MPVIAIITVKPGDQHRSSRGGGGYLERFGGRAAMGAFLALAAQVEQRVVDADRQPDQQDHRADRGVDVQQVAEQLGQPERRGDRGDPEQQGDAGRHERAEREHQDEQRDRQRRSPRPSGSPAAMRLLIALLALPSPNSPMNRPGMRGLDRGCRRQRRRDAVLRGRRVAGDLEGQKRGPTILRDLPLIARRQRRLDHRHRRRARQARDEVPHAPYGTRPLGACRAGSRSAPPRTARSRGNCFASV